VTYSGKHFTCVTKYPTQKMILKISLRVKWSPVFIYSCVGFVVQAPDALLNSNKLVKRKIYIALNSLYWWSLIKDLFQISTATQLKKLFGVSAIKLFTALIITITSVFFVIPYSHTSAERWDARRNTLAYDVVLMNVVKKVYSTGPRLSVPANFIRVKERFIIPKQINFLESWFSLVS